MDGSLSSARNCDDDAVFYLRNVTKTRTIFFRVSFYLYIVSSTMTEVQKRNETKSDKNCCKQTEQKLCTNENMKILSEIFLPTCLWN